MRADIKEVLESVILENEEQIKRKCTIADFLLDDISNADDEDNEPYHDPYVWYLSDEEVLDYKISLKRKRELITEIEQFIKDNYSCNFERKKQLRNEERDPKFASRMSDLVSEIFHYVYRVVLQNGGMSFEVNYTDCTLTILEDDGATLWVKLGSKTDCNFQELDARTMGLIAQDIWRKESRK
ncbi:hypothetical protein [Dysgonomonas sp. ZJ709]|uniref:hypothetical protein n=1 Tax=Dysgonomonas sp. ZJ709 TaxID=2709797 RepID=UPI0013EA93EC|nr:hypothetical protein [Dysgonomonas sp. ZJ709]